jgi:hypothetical protein
VWEGWTPQNFIDVLRPQVDSIMAGESWHKPFKTKTELLLWLTDNQPYYKKPIREVSEYFINRFKDRLEG